MGGEACGIGEGTHYGCECVMRRLAEAEARAASEQARRETAEAARDSLSRQVGAMSALVDEARAALSESERGRKEAEREVERFKEREAHFAKALSVADGGQYRADWDGAIERVLRERDEARSALREVRDLRASAALGITTSDVLARVREIAALALSGAGAEEGRHTAASHPGEER
jgi:chromosome segregation ATPase